MGTSRAPIPPMRAHSTIKLAPIKARPASARVVVPKRTGVVPSLANTAPAPAPAAAAGGAAAPPLPVLKAELEPGGAGIVPEELGLNQQLHGALTHAAAETKSIVMIRKTNRGSVIPFTKRAAIGKELSTKGKSSEAFFTYGNIAFFATLAKKLDPAADGTYFTTFEKEQDALIGALNPPASEQSRYFFVPKLVSTNPKDWPKWHSLAEETQHAIIERLNGDGAAETIDLEVDDRARGSAIQIKYLLKRVAFNSVSKEGRPNLARPNFVASDDAGCFQVFVEKSAVVDCPDLNPSGSTPEQSFKLKAEGYWTTDQNEARLGDCGETQRVGETTYFPVAVLAIAATESEARPGGSHPAAGANTRKLYEVVADYDLFMVAPSIKHFKNETLDASTPSLEARWWGPAHSIPSLARAAGGGAAHGRFLPRSVPGKGITSEYELDVGTAINRHLHIKAVQHGVETANLFFTSDSSEPVMFCPPEHVGADLAVHDGKVPLFFLNLEMFLQLMIPAGDPLSADSHDIIPGAWSKTKIVEGDDNRANFWPHYLFPLNLGWGTPLEGENPTRQKALKTWLTNQFFVQAPATSGADNSQIGLRNLRDHLFGAGAAVPEKITAEWILELFFRLNALDLRKGNILGELSAGYTALMETHFRYLKRLQYLFHFYLGVFESIDAWAVEQYHVSSFGELDKISGVKKKRLLAKKLYARAIVLCAEQAFGYLAFPESRLTAEGANSPFFSVVGRGSAPHGSPGRLKMAVARVRDVENNEVRFLKAYLHTLQVSEGRTPTCKLAQTPGQRKWELTVWDASKSGFMWTEVDDLNDVSKHLGQCLNQANKRLRARKLPFQFEVMESQAMQLFVKSPFLNEYPKWLLQTVKPALAVKRDQDHATDGLLHALTAYDGAFPTDAPGGGAGGAGGGAAAAPVAERDLTGTLAALRNFTWLPPEGGGGGAAGGEPAGDGGGGAGGAGGGAGGAGA